MAKAKGKGLLARLGAKARRFVKGKGGVRSVAKGANRSAKGAAASAAKGGNRSAQGAASSGKSSTRAALSAKAKRQPRNNSGRFS